MLGCAQQDATWHRTTGPAPPGFAWKGHAIDRRPDKKSITERPNAVIRTGSEVLRAEESDEMTEADFEPHEIVIDAMWLGVGKGIRLRVRHIPTGMFVMGDPIPSGRFGPDGYRSECDRLIGLLADEVHRENWTRHGSIGKADRRRRA